MFNLLPYEKLTTFIVILFVLQFAYAENSALCETRIHALEQRMKLLERNVLSVDVSFDKF